MYEAIAPYSEALEKRLPLIYQSCLEESEHFLQMQEVEGESNSDTRIELLEINKPWTRYRLMPVSGKKHQLRCHLNALGIPIQNDQIYPVLIPYQEYDLDFTKLLQLLAKEILAKEIYLDDPITKEKGHLAVGKSSNWDYIKSVYQYSSEYLQGSNGMREELGPDGLPGHDYFLDAVNHIDEAVKSNTIAIGAAKGSVFSLVETLGAMVGDLDLPSHLKSGCMGALDLAAELEAKLDKMK